MKSSGIKDNSEEEIEKVFKGFINQLKGNDIRVLALKGILKRLEDITTLKN